MKKGPTPITTLRVAHGGAGLARPEPAAVGVTSAQDRAFSSINLDSGITPAAKAFTQFAPYTAARRFICYYKL